jgi:hypothetical protein
MGWMAGVLDKSMLIANKVIKKMNDKVELFIPVYDSKFSIEFNIL